MENYVIIVAGGKGLRMGADIPKQFLELNGKMILIHTIEKFQQALPLARLVLVLPNNEIQRWKLLVKASEFENIPCIAGGHSRFQSVKAGLSMIPKNVIVGVHDAVRPLVSLTTIKDCFTEAENSGTAIPVVDLKESIRKVEGVNSCSLNRSKYKLVQTPQCFKSDLLQKAYQQKEQSNFTDDASVFESLGETLILVKGNSENIKITDPTDLKWAEILLKVE